MLRSYQLFAFLLAIVSGCPAANAGEILFETRTTTTVVSPWDALASWHAQTSSVTSTSLAQFTDINMSRSHQHSRLQLVFETADFTTLEFEFGLDAGLGAALYVNGDEQSATSEDLWWGNNWDAKDELLQLAGMAFTSGRHTIDLYWAENCCAGGQSGRFRAGDGQWQALSSANLARLAVPEPGTTVLLLVGLASLFAAKHGRHIHALS
jgi:hypothetical protein